MKSMSKDELMLTKTEEPELTENEDSEALSEEEAKEKTLPALATEHWKRNQDENRKKNDKKAETGAKKEIKKLSKKKPTAHLERHIMEKLRKKAPCNRFASGKETEI